MQSDAVTKEKMVNAVCLHCLSSEQPCGESAAVLELSVRVRARVSS